MDPCFLLQTSAGMMLVNTNVKLQMTVERALPALSSLCSVSDYYLYSNDQVKIHYALRFRATIL